MNDSAATIYIGSTYGERLPRPFLADVLAARKPVLWLNANIWQLARHAPALHRALRVAPGRCSTARRSPRCATGADVDAAVAARVGPDEYAELDRRPRAHPRRGRQGRRDELPWAVRSKNLTYVGEIPFPYTSETDRVLAFADLLFDLLAPATPERHRALVRLEDIDPTERPRAAPSRRRLPAQRGHSLRLRRRARATATRRERERR